MMTSPFDLLIRLWRNAIPCEETLVVADAREDQGFDRAAEVTRFAEGDGSWEEVGNGDGDGSGYGAGNGEDGYGYQAGNGEGDGCADGDGDGIVGGNGAGDGYGTRAGDGDGDGYWDNYSKRQPVTSYLFPNEAQEAPCDVE